MFEELPTNKASTKDHPIVNSNNNSTHRDKYAITTNIENSMYPDTKKA